jgi:hypothetical protein
MNHDSLNSTLLDHQDVIAIAVTQVMGSFVMTQVQCTARSLYSAFIARTLH